MPGAGGQQVCLDCLWLRHAIADFGRAWRRARRTGTALDECGNCGHCRVDHDPDRCDGVDRWFDGERVRSGPCGCRGFV